MFTKITKWLMFITSYVPLYLLLIISNLNIVKWSDWKSIENWQKAFLDNLCFNLIMILLSIISVIVLICVNCLKSNSHMECSEVEIKNSAGDILNYFITYLFPLLSMQIDNSTSILVNVVVFIIIGLLYVKSDLVYLNPMLILFHYDIVQINDKIVITHKRNGELQKSIRNRGWIGVRKIAEGIYLEKELPHKGDNKKSI